MSKFDTLSIPQSMADGGIIECKQCKVRYKSKYKTSFFRGLMSLGAIILASLFAMPMLVEIVPFYKLFKKESTLSTREWHAKFTGTEIQYTEDEMRDQFVATGMRLSSDLLPSTTYPWKFILRIILYGLLSIFLFCSLCHCVKLIKMKRNFGI